MKCWHWPIFSSPNAISMRFHLLMLNGLVETRTVSSTQLLSHLTQKTLFHNFSTVVFFLEFQVLNCKFTMHIKQLTVEAQRSCSYHLQSWEAVPPLLWWVDPVVHWAVLPDPQSWHVDPGPVCLCAQSRICDREKRFDQVKTTDISFVHSYSIEKPQRLSLLAV